MRHDGSVVVELQRTVKSVSLLWLGLMWRPQIPPSHLFHLQQVRINIVPGVFRVPVLHVLVYFFFQEIGDFAVVGMDGLVRSRQVFHQGREAVVQLSVWQSLRLVTVAVCAHNTTSVYIVVVTWVRAEPASTTASLSNSRILRKDASLYSKRCPKTKALIMLPTALVMVYWGSNGFPFKRDNHLFNYEIFCMCCIASTDQEPTCLVHLWKLHTWTCFPFECGFPVISGPLQSNAGVCGQIFSVFSTCSHCSVLCLCEYSNVIFKGSKWSKLQVSLLQR